MRITSLISARFPPLRPESADMLHLDALRLIAACGIVVVHSAGFIMRSAVSPRFGGTVHNLTLFVDMFFAVSGYVITWVYFDRIVDLRSYGAFLQKRVARLVPLHWAILAIYIAMGLFVAAHHIELHQDKGMFDWQCLPADVMLLHSTGICPDLTFNAPSWSISAEMFMYLSSPLMFWMLRRQPWVLGLAAVALGAVMTSHAREQDAWLFWTAAGGCLRAIPSFIFGALLFAFRETVCRLPLARYVFWLSLLGFLWGCSAGVRPIGLLLFLYGSVIGAVAADAQKRSGKLIGLLAAGGQLTYSSYMLHTLVINVLLNALADRLLHLQGPAVALMTLFTFFVIWPLSYLSLIFFERPARSWLSGSQCRSCLYGEDAADEEHVGLTAHASRT